MRFFGSLSKMKIHFPVIFAILVFAFSACSSGNSSPVVQPLSDNAGYLSAPATPGADKILEPFELTLDSKSRSVAGKILEFPIRSLTYDLSEGWASFDLTIINSGAILFDTQLTIESVTQNGRISVDQQTITLLKFGIVPHGIESISRHIDITFEPGVAPTIKGSLKASTSPLFRNSRTLLHTDKFADHAHDFSPFSGRIIADQVLLRFKKSISLSEQYKIMDSYRLLPVGVNLTNRFIQADILNGVFPDDIVSQLFENSAIDHAEVNTISFIDSYPDDPIFDPNDPAWEEDGINSWGQRRIQAPEAWDYYHDRVLDETGDIDTAYETNAPIIFFICDTGYKYHDDLAIDSLDLDFINLGINIVDPDEFPADDNGHGTLISGVCMGEGNNQIGMAGMSWNAHIIPLKTNDYAGMGDEFRSGIAISYAKEIALDYPEYRCVGNMSYGTHAQLPEIDRVNEGSAFEDAWPVKNLQFVAAAGNCANSKSPDPASSCYYPFSISADNHYPCAFPWVVSAAASRRSQSGGLDTEAGFTNWGWTVDISAPGVEILSTAYNAPDAYRRASGTSLASPFVAGLFALLWSRNPSLTKTEITKIIKKSTDPMSLPSGKVGKLGTGRINAYKALFSADYLKPVIGEKLSSGDIDGDGLDEVAIGLNGTVRNTGSVFVFRQDTEITGGGIEFGTDRMVTGTAFGDIDGDGADEILVLVLNDPCGYFIVDTIDSNNQEVYLLDYSYPDFTVSLLYSFDPDTVSELITTGDFDGDLVDEIAVLANNNPTGYFALNNGDTTPYNNSSIAIINGYGTLLNNIAIGEDTLGTAITSGDIDNDGADELIVGYINQPAGIYSADGVNEGHFLMLDNPISEFTELISDYSPTENRIIEQVLAINLDTDPADEIIISTLDYPAGYFENQDVLNDAALVIFDDAVVGLGEIARMEFDDSRMTFALTEGNIHPNDNDQFWAWFMINPTGVNYSDNPIGGQLLMVPYGLDEGTIVQRGEEASSAGGYRHFSGCVRNADLDSPDENNETALYAIENHERFSKRYYECHDDTGANLYITWEYRFPSYLNIFEQYFYPSNSTGVAPIEP